MHRFNVSLQSMSPWFDWDSSTSSLPETKSFLSATEINSLEYAGRKMYAPSKYLTPELQPPS